MDECGLSNKMPTKEAKGDIVIAIYFKVQEAVQQLYIMEYFRRQMHLKEGWAPALQ